MATTATPESSIVGRASREHARSAMRKPLNIRCDCGALTVIEDCALLLIRSHHRRRWLTLIYGSSDRILIAN
jgi:hypothetical protein